MIDTDIEEADDALRDIHVTEQHAGDGTQDLDIEQHGHHVQVKIRRQDAVDCPKMYHLQFTRKHVGKGGALELALVSVSSITSNLVKRTSTISLPAISTCLTTCWTHSFISFPHLTKHN